MCSRECREVWLESMKAGDHQNNISIGRRVILKWILRKQSGNMWIGFIWLR
jgi:hypothetical protein